MAQTATMGPPLSPRETRRSGRRSVPSVSASASKSPDSDQPPHEKVTSSRVSSSSANNRNRKLKQEDHDEVAEDRKQYTITSATSSGSNNGASSNKAKRKPKEKQTGNAETGDVDIASVEGHGQDPAEEEEEQGITRCVCGSADLLLPEDDPDAGEFMVQCETCKVWQHGLCMGYTSEDQVHDDDYYCELCKPDMHVDLLRKLSRKPRQTSTTSRLDPTMTSRVSRSHSPTFLLKQTSKRRNTMNSRDAAFDESLKEIIEATAAEAAAVNDTSFDETNISLPETNDNGKKKRKRTDEDNTSKKRTRSASTASDTHAGATVAVDPPPSEKALSLPPKAVVGRNRRGGRKVTTIDTAAPEPEEAPTTSNKRLGNGSRTKGTNAPKRPPLSTTISHGSGAATHEHGTRRNQSGAGGGQQIGTSAADARAYRHSHAYAVSQQALFTSWNLPDYLSHLEQMLPTDTPQPLEVRSGASNTAGAGSRGDSTERTMERGVKVKWPAKRMSVGDMNKRVRSLVEWVGREQASAQDRGRRRDALEKVLREQAETLPESNGVTEDPVSGDVSMAADEPNPAADRETPLTKSAVASQLMSESALEMSAQTMKMMEELMEELIGFQERFGPGAKSRERERRLVA